MRATPEPRLKVWTATGVTALTHWISEPMFYAVLQGEKGVEVGGQTYRLTAGEGISTSCGLPIAGHVAAASPTAPYMAISLDLDVDLLVDVMLDMPKAEDRWSCSAARGTLDGTLRDAFGRLLELLPDDDDRAFLWRRREAEFYYRLLRGPMGDTLRQLNPHHERRHRIKAVTDWLIGHAKDPVTVADLAARARMSVTSFHRHFRAITGQSPLAFQRQVRLLEARRLLESGDMGVTQVAFAVGYNSASQFSREYKALFGWPPVTDLPASLNSEARRAARDG